MQVFIKIMVMTRLDSLEPQTQINELTSRNGCRIYTYPPTTEDHKTVVLMHVSMK